MNVLYILGNGFDKAQGMKTSYPEFYQYLMENTDNGSPLLQQMKKEIKNDIDEGKDLWSDMEWGFATFTEKIKNVSELEDLHYEVSKHLQAFLEIQNKSFAPNQEQKNKFVGDFISPEKYIHATERDEFYNLMKMFGSGMDIKVISLNYTDTLEKLLSIKPSNNERVFNNHIRLTGICHVHGQLGSTIIVGVDNVGQIKNESFRKEDLVKMFMVKADSNLAMKNIRHSLCEDYIKQANLIILFGVSFGETDIRWWKLIGNEMKERKTLGIINYVFRPDDVPPDRLYRMTLVENESKRYLLNRMGVSTDEIEGRLYFVINSKMFNI